MYLSAAAGLLVGIMIGWFIHALTRHDDPDGPELQTPKCAEEGQIQVLGTVATDPEGFHLVSMRAVAVGPGTAAPDPAGVEPVGTEFPFCIGRTTETGTVHVWAEYEHVPATVLVHAEIPFDCAASGGGECRAGGGDPNELRSLPEEFQVAGVGGGGPAWVRTASRAIPQLRAVPAESTPRSRVWRGSDAGRVWVLRVRPTREGLIGTLGLTQTEPNGRRRFHTWTAIGVQARAETAFSPQPPPPAGVVLRPA